VRRFPTYNNKLSERKMKTPTMVLLAALVIAGQAFAGATTYTWTGNTSTEWNLSTNWDSNGVPTSADNASIPASPSGGRFPTISDASGTVAVRDFTVASGATVTQTGGTLQMAHDWKNSGTYNATGGTIQFTASGGAGPDFSLGTNQFFNVIVNSGVDPKFSNRANSSILIRGDFTNYNISLNVGTNATFTFNGIGDQTITSASTGINNTLGHLIVDKPSGTLSLASALNLAGNFSVSAGSVDPGANLLTIAGTFSSFSSGKIKVGASTLAGNYSKNPSPSAGTTVEYYASGSQTVSSSFTYSNLTLSGSGAKTISGTTVNGTLSMQGTATASGTSPTYGASSTLEYAGSSAQTTTSVEFPASSGPQNLTINNSSGVTLHADRTVNGTLTLTSGNITTGSHTLTIGSSGSISHTSGYVIGNLAMAFGTNSSKTFEVGTANRYSRVTVAVTAGTGTFSVSATQGGHPNALSTHALSQYWTLSSSGITNADLTFYYNAADVVGDETKYVIGKWDGASWTFPAGGSVDPVNHVATISGVSSFSDWTVGEQDALPIQMALFTANVVRNNQVEVAWRTVSETNNYGFEIYRKRGDAGEWTKTAFMEGHGTTLAPQSYTYVDAGLSFGKYCYRIKQVDLDGKSQTFPVMSVTVGVGPDKFILAQNYPNPFNPSTVIEFVVPGNGPATMKVYNVLGQEVATLFEGNAEAGEINTARFNASNLPSGLYFYTLRSAGKTDTKRMLLLK
jgi:hypothetical protein